MPKMNNWYLKYGVANNWRENPDSYTAPELVTQHISGEIFDDNRFQDGERVTTSTIIGKKEGKVVTRSGTLYELKDPLPDYEEKYPNAKQRLINSLPVID